MTQLYGSEGKAFPVLPGQTWQCGAHLYFCGDIADFAPVAFTFTYCDPPWNDALLNGFHTKAGRPHPPYHWQDIYRAVIEKSGDAPVWLEGGVKQTAEMVEMLPGPWTSKWDITYYKTRPATLVYSGKEEPWCDPLGMDDEDIPQFVIEHHPGVGIVLDPCAGRGLTALAAERAGWICLSNELNPARVSAALARMKKQTGLEPVRVQ